MEVIIKAMVNFFIISLIIVIAIYVVIAIFLNKFNKLVYGKGTAMAWIPIANIYLLGKLTVNKAVGWVLVICTFLTDEITTTINEVETTRTIIPGKLGSILSTITSLATSGLFIYAIVKYNKLKKDIKNQNIQLMEQQPMGPQPIDSQNSQDVNKL